MHEVLVNRLEGLSLPGKSVVRLTDRPDMTLDVYRGRKTTIQQQKSSNYPCLEHIFTVLNVFEPLKIYCISFPVSSSLAQTFVELFAFSLFSQGL